MLKMMSKALLGGLFATMSLTALASEPVEMRSYFVEDYQHIFRDNARVSDNANGISLGYGLALDKIWGLEFNAFTDSFTKNQGNPTAWSEYGAKISGMFFYSRDPVFSPYFGLGVGAIYSDEKVSGANSIDPMVDVGLGFFHYFNVFSMDMALRAEARYRWMDTNRIAAIGDLDETVLKVGLALPFGGRSEPAPAPVPAARVESAPIATAPLRNDVPADEPANVRAFIPVHFAFNKYNLSDKAKKVLDDAAQNIEAMLKDGPMTVELDGHTDSIGTDAYNKKLSARRAQAVADYLVSKGVSRDIITTRGYGKSKPAEDNKSEAGRAFNRRVVIRVIE